MRRLHRTLPSLVAALAAAGCSQDFTPSSVVEDLRVLAIVAAPPELDGTVASANTTLRAVLARPHGAAGNVVESWTFCPFSAGASTGYACAVPGCESALAANPDGTVTVHPVTEILACLATFGASLPPDLGGGGGGAAARLEVLVRYRADDGQRAREAVQRIPVWFAPPTQPLNLPPLFAPAPFALDGLPVSPCADTTPAGLLACPTVSTLRRATTLQLQATVNPTSIQTYPAGDRTVDETFGLYFFTTAGRLKDRLGVATRDLPGTGTELKHEEVPAGTSEALLWVVLRDLRGGEAVTGPYKIAVEP